MKPLAMVLVTLVTAGCNQIYDLEPTELAKPNYYPCECSCSRRVIAENGAAVLSLAGEGSVVDVVASGSRGEILDGPVDRPFNGNAATWWQVRFDGGVEGWVQESSLTLDDETLVTKQPRVCLPQQFNTYLGGSATPNLMDLQDLCGVSVTAEAEAVVNTKLAPLGRFLCQCAAEEALLDTNHDASCTVACADGDTLCLVAGSDPPDPTPEPLSAHVLQPTSECEVEGPLELLVGGRAPKDAPTVRGSLQVYGRPCTAGEACPVGLSYELTSDPISFDSGTIFASDPTFVEVSVSGATVPGVVDMGPFLGFFLGAVPAETAYSTLHGRRTSWPIGTTVAGRNTEGVALAMNWENKTCRLSGSLVGAAVVGDGDEGTLDAQADVALDGVIVNQPPRPDAGPDRTVECAGPDGADVTLDASGTTDADGNLAFFMWRRGASDGPQLAAPGANPVVATRQALGQETYFVQAVDGRFAADEDAVVVTVADATAPDVDCNAPATIDPTDVPVRGAGLSFTATAEDACTGVASVVVERVECTRPTACLASADGATLTIRASGGVGNVVRWVVAATDAAGNVRRRTCALEVVRKTP